MQHQRESGQLGGDLFQTGKVKLGFALEFVGAVARADGDGQGVASGAPHKLHSLVRVGIDVIGGGDMFLHTGQFAQFGFHPHSPGVGIFHHLFGHGDVFLEGQMRAVDHHRGETAVDAVPAHFKRRTVVQVHHDRHVALVQSGLHQLHDVFLSGVLAGSGGNLKNDGSFLFRRGLHDALDDFHVVYVKGADGVASPIGALKHVFGSDQRHGILLEYFKIYCCSSCSAAAAAPLL